VLTQGYWPTYRMLDCKLPSSIESCVQVLLTYSLSHLNIIIFTFTIHIHIEILIFIFLLYFINAYIYIYIYIYIN
jgi:hypothetical protein